MFMLLLSLPLLTLSIWGLVLGIRAEIRERPAVLARKRQRREDRINSRRVVVLDSLEADPAAASTASPWIGGSN